MSKNVLEFEPHKALFVTDYDPLIYYHAIFGLAEKILFPGGYLYFEINEMMGSSLIGLLEVSDYTDAEVVRDINGKERILKCRKNG
jgi:release factor glutamine methyltransferase